MDLVVYLSGEIHSDWREKLIEGANVKKLPIVFTSPVTDHGASDAAGDALGETGVSFWRDHQSAKVNAIRTKTLLNKCDVAIIRFGDQYKQWNAAYDAGYCAAMAKPYITLHDSSLVHPLKEVDASAMASAQDVDQVLSVLSYVVQEQAEA